jgi:uncharacterized membrane protein YfcA
LLFIANSKVDWYAGFILSLSNATGAALGARWGVRKGEFWIRIVLTTTIIGMALQLLGGSRWLSFLLF